MKIKVFNQVYYLEDMNIYQKKALALKIKIRLRDSVAVEEQALKDLDMKKVKAIEEAREGLNKILKILE